MKKLYIVLIYLGLLNCVSAQDPHFSQFYANPIYLAPSFAGGSDGPRFVLNFRDQWPKVPGNYITYAFSADHYLADFNSGLGLFFVSDNAGNGKLVTTNIGAAYSYKVKISSDIVFQPGLSAYYYSRYVDYNAVEFFSQLDNASPPQDLPIDKVQHADFAISALAYLENYWFGFNVDHLMNISPILRNDYRYTNMKISLFGGYQYQLGSRTRNKYNEHIHMAFNYYYQSQAHQLDVGGYYSRNPFIVGLWYRGIPVGNEIFSADAIIFMGGIKYSNYTFSYSYDMTIGNLISHTGGSHEISLIYSINSKLTGKKKYKAIPCPHF